jgi:hypothetical protein
LTATVVAVSVIIFIARVILQLVDIVGLMLTLLMTMTIVRSMTTMVSHIAVLVICVT